MKTHTVLIITHRLSTIKNVDDIYVFDKRNIIQSEAYDKFSEQEGIFKDLV